MTDSHGHDDRVGCDTNLGTSAQVPRNLSPGERDKKCSTSAQVLHDEDVRQVHHPSPLAAFDRILATIDRQSRLLAAYEAEREAGYTFVIKIHEHNLHVPQGALREWYAAHDHAEQVRQEEGL